ncbi:MAG: hypothetical protein IKL59_03340 [Clostridia bacterium]|nr:hypothetical protein [Clostridia bacterium]
MKWIWTDQTEAPCFAEFKLPFSYQKGKIVLKISAEYRYIAYVNGVFASNGQYPDVPWYKVYDEIDITHLALTGDNELRVYAFHMGLDGQVAYADIPCVAFEIYCDGERLCGSDEHTLARRLASYSAPDKTTRQLGYGFSYDFTAEQLPWNKAVVKETGYKEVPRPVAKTKVENEALGIVGAQGEFIKNGGNTAAEIVQNCWMRTVNFAAMTNSLARDKYRDLNTPVTFVKKEGDGVFIILDLGRNTVGFPRFKVSVKESCKAYLCWGEHLQDLRIRSYIGGRNFAYGLTLKAGENEFTEYFRRIGGRYMGFYVETDEVTVFKVGMLADEYPLKKPEKDFGDRFLNKIYETARRTMELCIHDHYEDCPWREQALYAGDSRIQMMFGYGAFAEYDMPRESIRMMALCSEDDGLIPMCAPSRLTFNITAGSFPWITSLCDYVEHSGDATFFGEMLPYVESIMKTFEKHTTDQGIMLFGEPRYWNFHEWSDGLTGPLNGKIWRDEYIKPEPDGALTAYGLFATTKLVEVLRRIGDTERAEKYNNYRKRLTDGIAAFYDEKKGLYRSYIDREQYHNYTNAIILASGVVTDKKCIENICAALKDPQKHGVIEMNLAYYSFKYDVLIKYDENGLDFAINEICDIFGGMLLEGSTSFWETTKGELDFNNAGSLCHGWSAVACYVLDKYYQPRRNKE